MNEIAVVIGCFNLGRTVEEAIDSVVAQTRPAAEIVVVDDGSTDISTRQRLAALSRRGFRVVRIANRGEGGARNYGVRLTSAPYLLFLDADDALESTYLEKTGARLDGDLGLDFVSTAMRGFGEANYVWTPPPPQLTTAFTRGTIPVTALLRRFMWETIGGFDEGLPVSTDLNFWLTALEHGFRGCVIDEPLFLRRVRSESLHHAAVRRGTHLQIAKTILRRHRRTIEGIGPRLLIEREAFILDQRSNWAGLERRLTELKAELSGLDHQIGQAQERLRERGQALVDFGDFQRLAPVSPVWGFERGRPVDRYYIERFLEAYRSDIRGRVLEIKDSNYTRIFGSPEVTAREALDVDPENPSATIVADLTRAEAVPSESFDCFIVTQTFHIIYDVRAALFHAHRILKPGGVLLATFPAVSRINYEDGGLDGGDYWRFTEASLGRMFGEVFGPANFEVMAGGNLKACIAFLYGLAIEEVPEAELEADDRRCPLVFCVRAVKPDSSATDAASERAPAVQVRTQTSGAILMYHRIAEPQTDPHQLCVSPAEFRGHMKYLAQRHPVLSLEKFARAAADGNLPNGAVAVTLDDGTLDGLESASPILMDLGIPATFFINTEDLHVPHEPWWDVLARIFLGEGAVPAELVIALGGAEQVFRMRDPGERAAAHAAVHPWLMGATLAERQRAMARIVQWSGMAVPPRPMHRALLPNEIRRLAERPGHTIGSHTVHHLLLPAQSGEQQDREIRENRRDLERLSGRPVTLFSYPYGVYDRHSVERIREARFLAAVTTNRALVSAYPDVYTLPRLNVTSVGVSEFARALQAAFSSAASAFS